MASTVLHATTTTNLPILNMPGQFAVAGTRIWTSIVHANSATETGNYLYYSDNNGQSWSQGPAFSTGTSASNTLMAAVSVSGTWYLHCISGGYNSQSAAMTARYLSSGVDSGTPGAFSAVLNVDVAGTNLGCGPQSMWVTDTASNPRIWVACRKTTAATTYETRLFYCPVGSAAGTAGNWVSLNNVGALSGSAGSKWSMGRQLTVAGVKKCLFVVLHGQGLTTDDYYSYVFDPSAASPAVGSPATFAAMTTGRKHPTSTADGPYQVVAVKDDYAVFGRVNGSGQTSWDFFKTVDGVTWTQPTGWSGVPAGKADLCCDGTNFFVVYNTTTGSYSSNVSAFSYRRITAAADGLLPAAPFSDTSGAIAACYAQSGTFSALYRDGTASPYNVRADYVYQLGGSDTATAGESSALAVAFTSADTASAVDENVTLAAQLTGGDTASGLDTTSGPTAALSGSDTAGAAEAASLDVALTAADLAFTSDDLVAFTALLAGADSATAAELVVARELTAGDAALAVDAAGPVVVQVQQPGYFTGGAAAPAMTGRTVAAEVAPGVMAAASMTGGAS